MYMYINGIFILDEQSVPLKIYICIPNMKTCLISLKRSLLYNAR